MTIRQTFTLVSWLNLGSSSTSNNLQIPRDCMLMGVYIGGAVVVGAATSVARIFVCPNAIANDQPAGIQIENIICEHAFDASTEHDIPPAFFNLLVPMSRGQTLCTVYKCGSAITSQAWVNLVFSYGN